MVKAKTLRRLFAAAFLAFCAWTLLTLPIPTPQYGPGVTPLADGGAVLARTTGRDADWTGTGGEPGASQWSSLTGINRSNVGRLERAWEHSAGELPAPGLAWPPRHKAIPLVVIDTLYYCTPFGRTVALHAATGELKWKFDPYQAGDDGNPLFSGDPVVRPCRGVAYWEDPAAAAEAACARRIFRSGGDRAVYALDAKTGRVCKDFGAAAGHPGYVTYAGLDAKGEGDVGNGSPPIVIGDVLVAAAGARDSLIDAANGIVRGFAARSGELRWEFDPIPPQHAHDTGAVNVWTLLSGDPARHLVFLATTSPSPDFYGVTRRFEIPYANAVVAVDVRTGEVAWHYQTVHHDLWDYDLPTAPLLVAIRKDGELRDVVIQPTKMGTVFVLDRDTGEPVFPVQETPVPGSRIEGEQASPTQPVPVLPEHIGKMSVTRDELFGLTPIDRAWCRRRFDSLRYEGMFTPPDPDGGLVIPGTMGGTNWGGTTYEPTTNLLIVKADSMASAVRLWKEQEAFEPTDFMTRRVDETEYVTRGDFFLSPLGVPCMPPPWGTLTAVDMDTGRIVWRVPLGQSTRFGITAPAFLNWGSPSIGGPVSTAGGLVFIAGTLDSRLRAYDTGTGRVLWEDKLPAPGMTVPITYEVDGRQFVAVSATGDVMFETQVSDLIVAYALPE